MTNRSLTDAINTTVLEALSNVHTITVAKVTSINQSTINCQPVINRVVDGQSIELPEFVQVPVISLQGGASSIKFPIVAGDYCLLLISERCFDSWYAGSDLSSPLEPRMHDYSDAFALVGVNPAATALTIPTTTTIEQDVVLNGNLQVNGNISVTGNIDVGGDVAVVGQVSCADVVVNGVSFNSHVHGGVQAGTSDTSTPK